MAQVKIDLNKETGKIKPMHAVNNGPVKLPSGNFEQYKELGIPFARNHDAALYTKYGGERTVDIRAIFPDFDADPYDPSNYDFTCTDHYSKTIMEAGAEVFYRLGNKIDHRVKRYDSVPPKDFKKWAIICEHIIKHYTEGWADGFHWDIKYWEIWNEPDNINCWTGEFEDFLELFKIAANHLKSVFPALKIGGPSFSTKKPVRVFLEYVKNNNVPIDFLSWHVYDFRTQIVEEHIREVRQIMDELGFNNAESILNEWNYVTGWGEKLNDTVRDIISMKGAAFNCAVMTIGQNTPVDMLMYYDARPNSRFSGIFDFYTFDKLKGYYSFLMFSKLYKLGIQFETVTDDDDIYVVAAKNTESFAVMVTYFTNDTEAKTKNIEVNLNNCPAKAYNILLLDNEHDADNVGKLEITNGKVCFNIEPNTVVMLESAE